MKKMKNYKEIVEAKKVKKIKGETNLGRSSIKSKDDVIRTLYDIEANVKGSYGKLAGKCAEALEDLR